eukprot:5714335-Alexandrium_andersonii.AAC.1
MSASLVGSEMCIRDRKLRTARFHSGMRHDESKRQSSCSREWCTTSRCNRDWKDFTQVLLYSLTAPNAERSA